MFRNIIKGFERSLIISTKRFPKSNPQQRLFTVSGNEENVRPPRVIDTDDEYIAPCVPYEADLEKGNNFNMLIETLRSKFYISNNEVDYILSNAGVLKTYREKALIKSVGILHGEGVTKGHFVEYPWLITLDNEHLQKKINVLKSIYGLRNITDFVPFLRLQLTRLRKVVTTLNREAKYIKHENRVYFLAAKLNVSPEIVTKYLVKRLFILEMPFEMFEKNLQNMINYNVEPMNILKDLWGFRYAPSAVELRLQRAIHAKKDKIMPWMVRCPETILQKSLQLSLDELKVLGDKTSAAEYVGERLGFSAEEAQALMNKHPQVNTVRVTKIKEVLDYLLDEAKFSPYEIAHVPRILCHKLETTKQRIEELKLYGCRPSSLVIVCRSQREYEKFLKQWQRNYNYEIKEDV